MMEKQRDGKMNTWLKGGKHNWNNNLQELNYRTFNQVRRLCLGSASGRKSKPARRLDCSDFKLSAACPYGRPQTELRAISAGRSLLWLLKPNQQEDVQEVELQPNQETTSSRYVSLAAAAIEDTSVDSFWYIFQIYGLKNKESHSCLAEYGNK